MAVDQPDKIDIIGIDNSSGSVVLTISDHLDWSDTYQHQLILQKKLNTYLAFVESGEITEQYPNSSGRSVVLEVVFKYRPDAGGLKFLERASQVIHSAGFEFRHRIFAE